MSAAHAIGWTTPRRSMTVGAARATDAPLAEVRQAPRRALVPLDEPTLALARGLSPDVDMEISFGLLYRAVADWLDVRDAAATEQCDAIVRSFAAHRRDRKRYQEVRRSVEDGGVQEVATTTGMQGVAR